MPLPADRQTGEQNLDVFFPVGPPHVSQRCMILYRRAAHVSEQYDPFLPFLMAFATS